MDSLRKYGSDAVRYWAAGGRLGADVTFDHAQLRVGRRLAIKMLNASRFVLGLAPRRTGNGEARVPGGRSAQRAARRGDAGAARRVIGQCTRALDGYDHTAALAAAEEFFWFFCDDYLELVKARAYGERGAGPGASARAALRLALAVILRLFAPFLPFVTEEVWSWWQDGSCTAAPWPGRRGDASRMSRARPAGRGVRRHRRDPGGQVGCPGIDADAGADAGGDGATGPPAPHPHGAQRRPGGRARSTG